MKKPLCLIHIILISFCFSVLNANDDNRQKPKSGLNGLESALNEIEDEFSSIEAKYLSPLVLSKDYTEPPAQKLSKAEYYFKNKDYISSGSLYYSLFSTREEKDYIWEESIYKLAESLYLNNNYISAVRYYEMLLTEKPNSRYQVETLKRLIASAYFLGEYSKAKNYYSQFVGIGYDISKDQELIYYLGKSLFFDKQYDEAMQVFVTIKENTQYYPQSQYFIGLIYLNNNELEKSKAFLLKVIETKDDGKYFKFESVKNLSILALARINFEQKDYILATDFYLKLDRKSSYFAESYFELCWAYIKRGEYEKAIESLRLLKYISPGAIYVPQAELLEANVYIRQKKYGDAMVIFNNIVKDYSKIREELVTINSNKLSFNMASSKEDSSLSIYSPIVRSLLKDNKKFSHSIKLQDEIKIVEEELERVEKIENKLSSIVGNKNAASIFPPLKKGTETAIALQNRLVNYKNDIMLFKKNLFWNKLTESEKTNFNSLETEKKQLEGRMKDMPLSGDEIEQKAAEYARKIILMEEELHRVSLQTKTFFEQLDAINAYYMKTKSGEINQKVVERIEEEKQSVQNMLTLLNQYKEETEKEKNRLVLGGDMISKMIIVRNSYRKIVDEQEDLFNSLSQRETDLDSSIERMNGRINKLYDRMDVFYTKLNSVISDIITKIKDSYENERMKISEYKSQLIEIKTDVNEMATLSMFSNINKVKGTFDDIVLQADLGIIDVAWERKEGATKNLVKYRTQMAKEIQQLYLNLENSE